MLAFKMMLFHESEIALERCLHRLSCGVFLDAGIENLITGAKLLDHFFWSGVFRECLEEIFFAFKNRRGPGESRLRHQSRGETVSRRRSRETQRLIDVFGILAPGIDPACLGSG